MAWEETEQWKRGNGKWKVRKNRQIAYPASVVFYTNNDKLPAGRELLNAGIKQNDVLVGYGGKPITTDMRGLNADLRVNYKVGQRLPLTLIRGGKRIDARVLLVSND